MQSRGATEITGGFGILTRRSLLGSMVALLVRRQRLWTLGKERFRLSKSLQLSALLAVVLQVFLPAAAGV